MGASEKFLRILQWFEEFYRALGCSMNSWSSLDFWRVLGVLRSSEELYGVIINLESMWGYPDHSGHIIPAVQKNRCAIVPSVTNTDGLSLSALRRVPE